MHPSLQHCLHQSRYGSVRQQMNGSRRCGMYIYNGILLSYKNKNLAFAATQMDLESIMLSKISKRKTEKCLPSSITEKPADCWLEVSLICQSLKAFFTLRIFLFTFVVFCNFTVRNLVANFYLFSDFIEIYLTYSITTWHSSMIK